MDRHQNSQTHSKLAQAALQQRIEQDLQTALVAADGVHCPWQQHPFAAEQVTVDASPHAQIAYPWNPADPAAEAFFEQAERTVGFEAWQEAEIAARASSFFAQVDRLWTATSLQSKLVQKFAVRIPEALLTAIAQHAQSVVSSSLSLADQLVHCVDGLLPSLAAEDLQVLARPLAYAMRGDSETPSWEALLNGMRAADWQALSDIEQARVSLAIARYALEELDRSPST